MCVIAYACVCVCVRACMWACVRACVLLSDGAAAVVLASRQKAKELGLTVIAVVAGFADGAQVSLSVLFIFLFFTRMIV